MGIALVVALAAGVVLVGGGALLRVKLARWGNPEIRIETSMGTMTAELRADKAPDTVASFHAYADDGFYDGLIFHRVMDEFMIQGGSTTADYQDRPTRGPIANEARPDLPNRRGTLAMARGDHPDSATSGFYINLVDNAGLDADPARGLRGYCVFGELTDGFDVAERIGAVPTGPGGPFKANVPTEPVVIRSIRRIE